MEQQSEDTIHQQQFIQFMCFKADPAWRRLPATVRAEGRETFAQTVEEFATEVTTYSYSTLGLKAGTELLLWRKSTTPIVLQEMTSRLQLSGIGTYLEPTVSLFGFTRPSLYTRRHTAQEQALDIAERCTYLIVYPFSKTTEWYLMSKEARQGMMNEHMR